MPHIIVEHSANLEREGADISGILVAMHDALAACGIEMGRLKTRAHSLTHSVVGEADANKGRMFHITLLLLEGRDVPTKQRYAAAIHETAKLHLSGKIPDCKITCEVRDMAKETYILG